MDAPVEGDLTISAITVLELDRGVRQRARSDAAQGVRLRLWLDEAVRPLFAGRILAVDERVALVAAGLHFPDRMPDMDALIAATALVHGLTFVTRNVRDMERTGAALLNPRDLAG
jgi:toxin FitB